MANQQQGQFKGRNPQDPARKVPAAPHEEKHGAKRAAPEKPFGERQEPGRRGPAQKTPEQHGKGAHKASPAREPGRRE